MNSKYKKDMEEEKKNNEIDVLALVMTVLKQWRTLMKFAGVFSVIGVIVALATPKEYTSEVVLAPEMSSGGIGVSSNLADMASNFGIDLGSKSSMDAIYPELYPDVFSSTDFIRALFDVSVRTKEDNTPCTYEKHLTQDSKLPFWNYPSVWLGKLLAKPKDNGAKGVKDSYRLSKDETVLCKAISSSITCVIDKKTSEITISVTDQDPLVAAIMADTLQLRLQEYITEYRTKKARNDYDYYKKMMNEAKKRYEVAQRKYAGYSDSNMDVILQSVNAHRDQLENEMQLQYNVYNQMSAQMKQAEAKIQERTPAFTIIQKPYMPMRASSRSRSATVLIFLIFGCICGAAWILFDKKLLHKEKEDMEEC